MKPIKLVNSYVYVVLEHHSKGKDATVHGVYINREEALGKVESMTLKGAKGYLAVLKKHLIGKERDIMEFWSQKGCY